MMTVDLSNYSKVFSDDFSEGLNVYDGTSGLWTAGPRRDKLQTNSDQSVFLDGREITSGGAMPGVNPFTVKDGVLTIGSGELSEAELEAVRDVMDQTGETAAADSVRYYTGRISTNDSWSQTYGYFEAELRIPEGKGHWSGFWLTHAGEGWPPETTFEFYGRGLNGEATPLDNAFNTAVIFDEENNAGTGLVNDVDITNSYVRTDAHGTILRNPDGSLAAAGGTEQGTFLRADGTSRFVATNDTTAGGSWVSANNRAYQHLDITGPGSGESIYDQFWTYGIEWDPETITFWMGPDRDSMQVVYQTPTTGDHHVPMTLILNDQIGTKTGWWDPLLDGSGSPQEGMFGPDNGFDIRSVSVFMRNPSDTVTTTTPGAAIVGTDAGETILGTSGDDRIVTGHGLDVVKLGGGADRIRVTRGADNNIIEGFGADDVLVLEGYNIENSQDALARLTQVGSDVWLINGAYPASPQTTVFRGTEVSQFTAENFDVRWSETPDSWSSALRDGSQQREVSADGRIHARQAWVDLDSDGVINTDPGSPGYERADVATRFFQSGRDSVMVGSGEGDIYLGVRGGGRIIEAVNGGIDTVRTASSYTLAENVENLVSTYKDPAATGERREFGGNGLDNMLTGASGGEIFDGGAGDDLIDISAGGADLILVSAGDGHDEIRGLGRDDQIVLADHAFSGWAGFASRMVQEGSSAVITLGTDQSLRLADVSAAALTEDQFVFKPASPGAPDGDGTDSLAEIGQRTVTFVCSDRDGETPAGAGPDVFEGTGPDGMGGLAGDYWDAL